MIATSSTPTRAAAHGPFVEALDQPIDRQAVQQLQGEQEQQRNQRIILDHVEAIGTSGEWLRGHFATQNGAKES